MRAEVDEDDRRGELRVSSGHNVSTSRVPSSGRRHTVCCQQCSGWLVPFRARLEPRASIEKIERSDKERAPTSPNLANVDQHPEAD
jgi:hypothetical protein